MKIVLSNDLLVKINQKNFKSLISIIKLKKSSTLILIKGKTLEIPIKLNPELKYIAEIKNNTLYIFEKKIKNNLLETNKDNKKIFNNIKNTIEKLFNSENKNKFIENEINYLLFDKLYSKINDRKQNKKKFKNFFLKNKKVDDYYFIFNLPYYNKLIKVFIKIDNNKNIFINIFSEKLEETENYEFTNNLKNIMQSTYKVLKINFYKNIEDFYKNIYALLDVNKIDIKV